ncbi:fructose-bisphosphate aldolase [Luteibacter sp. OK325]|nr:class II fructose-bisphosphate aldolase [Luteibacter sp. OK325]PTR34072.1 fructose-bisphosphate aldolase [Luteibacter sp. OK325]
MLDLRLSLTRAQERGVAVAHFNVSELAALKAVSLSARELDVPVIIGVSEGEREFFGVRQIAAVVRSIRDEFDFPIFLNADHTHSLAKAVEAAKAGFDAVAFDGSALSLEENASMTRHAVEQLKSINPKILVEGEIGDIGTGSEVHDTVPDLSKSLTTPEEAAQFVESTGIDILAPAVGTLHGMFRIAPGQVPPRLNIELIGKIKAATGVFLTLHGGSGTADDEFTRAIGAGINIIHINTELRIAWRRGLEEGLAERPNDVVPYRILPHALEAVKQVAMARMRLFNGRA